MDDSPRSSKRRKLDTPKRIESNAATKPPTGKASGRLAKKPATIANGSAVLEVEDKPAPARKGRSLKGASNGASVKSAAVEDIDVYDDIEGALNVQVSSRPSRQLQAASRQDSTSTGPCTDTPQIEPIAKRRRGRPTKAETASRNAAKKLANGEKSGENVEAERKTAAAPAKRTKRTPVASVRKPAAPRANGRKKKEPSPVVEEETDADELQEGTKAATPSKPRSTRKPAASTRKKVLLTETENDEAVTDASPSSRRKPPASARRRQNRTDHITNDDEERWSNAEEQTNGHDEDDMDIDGNSILGSVLDPTEPSPFNKPTSAQKEKDKGKQKAALPLLYSDLAPGRELDLLKTIVVERITNKRPSPLVGLDEEYKSVYQLVEHTITAGEGNSMLVIGARGSGKTALVNKVLSEVSKENGGQYHVVRLNGFVHTDDKIALRDIWRQLGKEMDIEEDGSGPGKNYADTLATLLALLSHPSEQTGEITDEVAKAVIFVMDEFDLFAQHPRQTLLYNLFDIAQSRKAPIAVLGLTTRIDVTNSLEKRVKSRFSHRYVHLKLATTFTAFQEICKTCLLLHPEQLSVQERGILEGGIKDTTPAKKTKRNEATPSPLALWNTNISKLFSNPSFLTTHLAPPFYHSKSISRILLSFLLPTASLSPTTSFAPTTHLYAPDSELALIPALSTLALSLLIAAARLDIIHDTDTCNFNMAYDEYVTLASRARIQSAAGGLSSSSAASTVWGKDVARREWEGLVDLGLVMPVLQAQVGAFGMVRCDVALEEVGEVLRGIRGGVSGLERWCRSICAVELLFALFG